MSDDDRFEVQRLQRATGLWLNLEPDNSRPREDAEKGLAHLRETMPGEAFRVVPFGFGPHARLGDVRPDGSIVVKDGFAYCDSGHLASTAVIITLEQAANAEPYGWEAWEGPYAGAEGMVVRVRR